MLTYYYNTDVIGEAFDDTVLVIDPLDSEALVITGVGADIWRLYQTGEKLSIQDILDKLSDLYGFLDIREVKEITDFIINLANRNIIVKVKVI